jgi:hypothetical protein
MRPTLIVLSTAGTRLLPLVIIVFVADLLAMIVYTLRKGKVDDDSAAGSAGDGNPIWTAGWTRWAQIDRPCR